MKTGRRILATLPIAALVAVTAAMQSSGDTLRTADSLATSADSAKREITGPLRLVADVSERRLTLYGGDEEIQSFAVAVGTGQGSHAAGVVQDPPGDLESVMGAARRNVGAQPHRRRSRARRATR